MTTTLITNPEPLLTIDDALDYITYNRGAKQFESSAYSCGHILGRFWYVHLTENDKGKLLGSFADPFDKATWDDIIKALTFLLEN